MPLYTVEISLEAGMVLICNSFSSSHIHCKIHTLHPLVTMTILQHSITMSISTTVCSRTVQLPEEGPSGPKCCKVYWSLMHSRIDDYSRANIQFLNRSILGQRDQAVVWDSDYHNLDIATQCRSASRKKQPLLDKDEGSIVKKYVGGQEHWQKDHTQL